MANGDLGNHFETIGALNEAADAFSRMRQDVTTSQHITECGVALANISIQRRDWTMGLNNLGKVLSLQSTDNDGRQLAWTKVAYPVALLGLGHFEDAAKSFLQINSTIPSKSYNSVASPSDIATYAGLLALATMERAKLQERVLDNANFRGFLEHEPYVRKAVSHFVNGRYSNCLETLERYRTDYCLDIYLYKHVASIFSRIRSKCIIQYFIPFSCVSLDSLAGSFAKSEESLEEELAAMIREKSLRARIDAKNKVR